MSEDYPGHFTSRKVSDQFNTLPETIPDSLPAWLAHYLQLAVTGVRSTSVVPKIGLHLKRFNDFFANRYGHDRLSSCMQRDVLAWQTALKEQGLAPATINNHLASLSAFTTWVHSQNSHLFARGDPAKGIAEIGLPPLEPRALNSEQVLSLKNICDRLERFHQLKGRRHRTVSKLQTYGRPWRDRAIIFTLLSTGLRREELVQINLEQLVPNTLEGLREGRKARINKVKGKGKTERSVFLSADARSALADYLEKERDRDTTPLSKALFLSATGRPARAKEGRLSTRAINLILTQIGHWHDGEIRDENRKISPLRPHDLRHTFAFQLAKVTGSDAYELERRLGHRSQRYIQRYTNPPEAIAAAYIEEF